jgi:hypothetical protein
MPEEGLARAKDTFNLIRKRREAAQKVLGEQTMLAPPFERLEKEARRRKLGAKNGDVAASTVSDR